MQALSRNFTHTSSYFSPFTFESNTVNQQVAFSQRWAEKIKKIILLSEKTSDSY